MGLLFLFRRIMLQQLIDQEIEGIKRKFDDQLQFIADPEKLRDELVDAEMRLESAIQTANMQIEGGFFAKLGKKYKADVQAKEKALFLRTRR